MPNSLSFDVAFTRTQIEKILADPNVDHIIIHGTYTFNPEKGSRNFWEMSAVAEGTTKEVTQGIARGIDINKISGGSAAFACIRPCP